MNTNIKVTKSMLTITKVLHKSLTVSIRVNSLLLCLSFILHNFFTVVSTDTSSKWVWFRFRLATGQRTFAYRAVSLWNSLDEDLRNATTVKAFKKALKLVMNDCMTVSI